MGGDLNLKKSWHPLLMSNQRIVWQAEQKALEERKRTDQMMKEREEQRQLEELQAMQEAAGGKKRLNRVDWMYSGPSSGQTGITEETEGYLLGKRRIDGLIKGTEHKKLEKAAEEDSFMALQNANTLRDTASKIREDPMLAIKKQEQAAYEALMNDPVRRRMLLKATGSDAPIQDKGHKHKRHRRHEDRREYHRHRHSGRSDKDDFTRRFSESSSNSRSPSPYYKRARDSTTRRRSMSPRQDPRNDRSSSPYHASRKGFTSQRRSRSPKREGSGYRSSPPYHHRVKDSVARRRSRSPKRGLAEHRPLIKSQSWSISNGQYSADHRPSSDDRAARLAAMQQAATELDEDRARRIAAIEEREKADGIADDAARTRSGKFGGKGDFVHGLNRKAGNLDIGERIRRGKGGLERGRGEE